MTAGAMIWSVAFDAPVPTDDGYGGATTAWQERHCCPAEIVFLKGGEGVQAARLSGRQPVIIKVRVCSAAAAITTDWRARDRRSGVAYNIRDKKITPDRMFFEMMAESGVAA